MAAIISRKMRMRFSNVKRMPCQTVKGTGVPKRVISGKQTALSDRQIVLSGWQKTLLIREQVLQADIEHHQAEGGPVQTDLGPLRLADGGSLRPVRLSEARGGRTGHRGPLRRIEDDRQAPRRSTKRVQLAQTALTSGHVTPMETPLGEEMLKFGWDLSWTAIFGCSETALVDLKGI